MDGVNENFAAIDANAGLPRGRLEAMPKIAYGTYKGSGGTSLTLNIGFTPRLAAASARYRTGVNAVTAAAGIASGKEEGADVLQHMPDGDRQLRHAARDRQGVRGEVDTLPGQGADLLPPPLLSTRRYSRRNGKANGAGRSGRAP